MTEFPPMPTLVFLLATSFGTSLLTIFVVSRSAENLIRAERQNFARMYRLRQLLPAGVGADTTAPQSADPCSALGLRSKRPSSQL
jgi:hypothetical protein